MKNRFLLLYSISLLLLLVINTSCTGENSTSPKTNEAKIDFQNEGHELVYNMVQKVGNYKQLYDKKDVIYTYAYQTPDGSADVSTEKYIFGGELSYGKYEKHERTLADLDGVIEQGFDGKEYWLKNNGTIITDTNALKRVAFNRPTNFYWFTMMQKLLDPGLTYEHLGEQSIDGEKYDVVKVTFDSSDDKPKDIYQLYINQKTMLVDQFLFTVADFGKMEVPNLMKLTYEKVDGLLIPTKRLYKKSTWDAEISDEPWIKVTWSDIKFNNNFTKKDFLK